MQTEVLSIDDLITEAAHRHAIDGELLYETIECESSFVPDARGDGGKSRGLAQIHRDYWPDISDAEADDPAFAIEFMASKFAEGRGDLWTCYRLLS